ncbi:MAG: DNA repair protein RecO C-terminal domain-containing protein [Polyangiaceae bacterium]|nr:DNA repair protein RecO C-terminal domain-containing protein [Polyangiaceae bacterium]
MNSPRRPGRPVQTRHRGPALLLRAVPYGEADAVFTFFFRDLGRAAGLARNARRAPTGRRRAMQVDAMHTLDVTVDEASGGGGGELLHVREARIDRPRVRLIADLDRLDAAGRALRWARQATPARAPEPDLWELLVTLLDHLDDAADPVTPEARLAGAGLRLLAVLGYGLSFEACVRCGRTCEPGRAAMLDPPGGGLVCRACGGGPFRLSADERARAERAAAGDDTAFGPGDAAAALGWVEEALAVHAPPPARGARAMRTPPAPPVASDRDEPNEPGHAPREPDERGD